LDWSSICEWEHVGLIQEVVLHEIVKEGCTENPIPIVDDVTTIHDVTEDVNEIGPWDLATS
jgi:hypothetical protein